jgi:membrane protein
VLKWWEEFSKRPFVAHLLRAVDRFNLRGGVQLAAAITYFSVLSLVPILMLLFSVLGFTATVFRPELLGMVENWINDNFPANSDLGHGLHDVLINALTQWASFFATSLLIAAWIGSGWIGNTKRAVRLLMREDVDNPGKQLIMPWTSWPTSPGSSGCSWDWLPRSRPRPWPPPWAAPSASGSASVAASAGPR